MYLSLNKAVANRTSLCTVVCLILVSVRARLLCHVRLGIVSGFQCRADAAMFRRASGATKKCINTAPRSTVWLESSPTRQGFLPRPSAGRRWSHRGLCKTSGHREFRSGQPHPLSTRIPTILAAHPQLVPTSNPGTQILRVTQKPPPPTKSHGCQ